MALATLLMALANVAVAGKGRGVIKVRPFVIHSDAKVKAPSVPDVNGCLDNVCALSGQQCSDIPAPGMGFTCS